MNTNYKEKAVGAEILLSREICCPALPDNEFSERSEEDQLYYGQ